MAEEVPVSDVLCNATEYLCKLGSNLRSRSENLKLKRISKDKLRNAHAVRKAASKLLLMCELSKKSLENVEKGVKRVLTIVDASRCSPSVGAKTKNVSPRCRSSNKEYFYFEYDSYKLKISKKILLKHYTSLKVHTKSMPATMLDKYPVYYNCNLYQKRKKCKESVTKKDHEIEDSSVMVIKNNEKNKKSVSDSKYTENHSKDVAREKKSDDVSKIPKKTEKIEEKSHKNVKGASDSETSKISKESETESKQNETLSKKDSNSEKKLTDKLQKPNDVEIDINSATDSKKLIKIDKAKSKKENDEKECKAKNIQSRDKSGSTSESELSSGKASENKPEEKKDDKQRIKDKTEKSRRSKSVRFLDESSESSLNGSDKGNDKKKRKLSKESESNDIVDLIDDDDCSESLKEIEKSHEDRTEKDTDDKSESVQKPMIKLVSLNKLLKPDIVEKLDGNTGKKVLKQTSIKTYRGKKPTVDEAYLLEKRKEASAFKPKKFNVSVMRLPKFSDNFLCKYGLKKITQNGKIIYKVANKAVTDSESLALDESARTSPKKSKEFTDNDADQSKKKINEGVTETKNALLNSDSDSPDTITKPSKTTKKDSVSKTKNALLDSDNSDSKQGSDSPKKDTLEKTKNALLNSDSDSSDSNKKAKTEQENKNKSKVALHDSDSESSGRNTKQGTDSDKSDSKKKSKTSKKELSRTKAALLDSDSDSEHSKGKSKTPKKYSSSKTLLCALLDSDSDSLGNKNNQEIIKKHSLTENETAILNSKSDNSDSKKNLKKSKKDLSKTKTALLDSDSDKSDTEGKSKAEAKDSLYKSKTALLDSDSDSSSNKNNQTKTALLNSDCDNSEGKKNSKKSKKDLSKTKTALLDSDSDKSDTEEKSKAQEKDSLHKSKTALLDSDSDSSSNKNNQELIKKHSLSETKTALLNSDSDNSDGKKNSETSKKDLSKTKTALLDSDSDNSGNKEKSKAQEKDSLSKSKTALLDSDSDSSGSTNKQETTRRNSSSKTKTALLNSDSDNSDSKKNSDTSKNDSLSKTRTGLLHSDSDSCGSKQKSDASLSPKKDSLSETKNALLNSDSDSSNSKSKPEKKSSSNNYEEKKETPDLLKDTPDNNEKGNDTNADESHALKSVESPGTPKSKKQDKDQTTPRSKRKMIMESMKAKKMLLTYSSSSDTDDEQMKNAMKDVRNSLLNQSSSSDDDIDIKKIIQANRRQLATPSDSDNSVKKSKRQKKRIKSLSKEKDDKKADIGQFDGTNDEQSDSSSSQMGRSKTKVASSSNQSSENVDSNDIEINRLTDLSSLNRRRRDRREKGPRSTRRMPKAPVIEEALGPESSDAVSEAESDIGEMEELPAVSLQDLNGDGINHLAKEDLLAESDSSSSQNDKENGSEDENKEDSEEEEKIKSIRRKANAISSDSEAGASRRKAERVSDFEDSEADESEPRKKTKRKKKDSDSDASQSSNDGSKKKRRRIKQVNDSDGSGSDSENEGKNKHGRKNIRKVMSKDQLEEATKKAARQEKERVARIAERQKMYNNLEFDESGKPDEVVLDKVVLDFDPDTKEPLIEVDRGLVKKLKPHQANGIKFMWNACFESVKRIKKDRGSGCILAHCMGLGKTLQVVSLTHTLLTHGSLTGVKRVLVVCPLSTVLNWVNEFNMWLKHSNKDYDVDIFELSRHKQNSERAWQLQQWVDCGGVCVLGYEMFRNLSQDNNKKFKKKMLKTFQEALVDPGPDLVVCDEGHLLKNEKTSLSQSMNRVRTLRRIVLTGTPLQNNLKEYYCMVQFVKPNLLGKYNEYLNRFVNPITNGQYTDSTERDISVMKRRSHVLHTMLDGAVQRRDYGVLAPFLPPKHEFVLFITLTDIQIKLYQHYLDNYSRRPLPGKSSGFLFPDFQSLQRIWTHPLVLKYNSERYEIMQQKKRDKEEEDSEGSIADFIDDDSTPDESSTEESSDDLSDMSDDSRKKSKKKKSAKKAKAKESKATARRGTRANPIEMAEDEKPNSDIEEVKYENPTEWWMKLVSDEELEDIRHSSKLLLLFDILRQCEAIGDKLLVFSQSLYSLDLIEHFLGKVDEATQEGRIDEKFAGHVGSWSPGVDYFRLDGSTSCENRSIWCKNFNREDNPRARLFLISTRAGGLGINLVAANRVVIFDVSWNPSHDVQSIFRVYRFGQKKPCYIYRFLAMGTMEEKIYERQVTKQAISKRVIDEQQIDRHYAANDLAELYKFEPTPPEPRPVPKLPKDRLFAEMLKEHEAQIYRFHEHDSLLENKEEETLSEEERKRAWEEFENEKRAPPPAPFPSNWAMTNGMASLIQQQQQQLAYTALAAMIRKDLPTINDNQLRDMLPAICNANPGMFGGYDYGLMQKMSEIYKYAAQPGLMNPSMMNPVMNPAGGMSTSSSLQYEPPWQRQQQQQQQMRLQQLMQQQQQHGMGAKFYAGGLGSRDPVAMALQQQRAREFLLGGGGAAPSAAAGAGAGAGAGRPRGRPPLQPRAPAAADVVNLADSD